MAAGPHLVTDTARPKPAGEVRPAPKGAPTPDDSDCPPVGRGRKNPRLESRDRKHDRDRKNQCSEHLHPTGFCHPKGTNTNTNPPGQRLQVLNPDDDCEDRTRIQPRNAAADMRGRGLRPRLKNATTGGDGGEPAEGEGEDRQSQLSGRRGDEEALEGEAERARARAATAGGQEAQERCQGEPNRRKRAAREVARAALGDGAGPAGDL